MTGPWRWRWQLTLRIELAGVESFAKMLSAPANTSRAWSFAIALSGVRSCEKRGEKREDLEAVSVKFPVEESAAMASKLTLTFRR